MGSRTTRTLSFFIVASISLLVLFPHSSVTAADGPLTASMRAAQVACGIVGGKFDYNSNYSGAQPVRDGGSSSCTEGLVDFDCKHKEDGSLNCTAKRTTSPVNAHVDPDGGIETNDTTGSADTSAGPLAGQPILLDTEPGISLEQRTTDLINSCHVLGGTEIVTAFFDRSNALVGSGITCNGGLADGFDCVDAWKSFICQWLRGGPEGEMVIETQLTLVTELSQSAVVEGVPAGPPPTVQPQSTAVDNSEAPVATDTPSESPTEASVAPPQSPPTPTLAPTAVAVEPTMAPTTVPAEPTVAPPSNPPPPKNDNAVPPGEGIEPVAPTPTPVVLT